MANRIERLTFEGTDIVVQINRQKLRVATSTISTRLLRANDKIRQNFRFSPAGHVVFWPNLDLEVSVASLMQMASRYWC